MHFQNYVFSHPSSGWLTANLEDSGTLVDWLEGLGEWVNGWGGWVSGGQVGEVGWVGDWLERLGKWGTCWRD